MTEVAATPIATLPNSGFALGLDFDAPTADAYWRLAEDVVAVPLPRHWLFGWPDEVQDDMAPECQLVTHGIYCGSPDAYKKPKAKQLIAEADDWVMLLQLDTDWDGPGWCWGDAGRIYFWIRKEDLAQRRFDRTWLILQCG
jgi:uncharacterized protein YwqG